MFLTNSFFSKLRDHNEEDHTNSAMSDEEYDNHVATDNGNIIDDNSNSNYVTDNINTRADRHSKGNKNKLDTKSKIKISKNSNENEANNTHSRPFNPEVVHDPENKGVMTQGDRLNAIKARKQTQSLQGGVKMENMKNIMTGEPNHSRVKSVPAPLALQGGMGSGRGSSSATSTGKLYRLLDKVYATVRYIS